MTAFATAPPHIESISPAHQLAMPRYEVAHAPPPPLSLEETAVRLLATDERPVANVQLWKTGNGVGATAIAQAIAATHQAEVQLRVFEVREAGLEHERADDPYSGSPLRLDQLRGIAVVVCAPDDVLAAAQQAKRLMAYLRPLVLINRRWPVRTTKDHKAVQAVLEAHRIPAHEIPFCPRGRKRRQETASTLALPSATKEILYGYARTCCTSR